eukprot:900906-Amphidinium_carterae.2
MPSSRGYAELRSLVELHERGVSTLQASIQVAALLGGVLTKVTAYSYFGDHTRVASLLCGWRWNPVNAVLGRRRSKIALHRLRFRSVRDR